MGDNRTKAKELEPFFKYPGGKRWLAPLIAEEFERSGATTFVEPFLGAGAAALRVKAERYVLNDLNDAVINVWKEAVSAPSLFHLRVKRYDNFAPHTEAAFACAKETINAARRVRETGEDGTKADESRNRRELAVITLYLIAHGYNGLWRENSRGEHNVPFGGHHQRRFHYPDEEHLIAVSRHLRGRSTFFCEDFEPVIDRAPHGSFIYCDPPYPRGFVAYTAQGFSELDQRRLSSSLQRAAARGVHVVASNGKSPSIEEIYGWARCEEVKERRPIGAKGDRRKAASCLLIRSY